MLNSIHLEETVLTRYPSELSGGMAQRVMVGMMLWLQPSLLIGDEPTSSLDAPIGVEIMELIIERVEERNASFLLVSHDVDMVCRFCDRVIVMYEGQIVEDLLTKDIHNAQHFHTQSLLHAKTILRDQT